MYLQAITLGYAVPAEAFNASIHSVFRSAVNLKLEGDWHLLTLVSSFDADLPHGIRVDTPDGFTFEHLQVGAAVTCRNGVVRFHSALIEVDLSKARHWDFNLSACTFDATNPCVGSVMQSVWRALNERQLAYGAEMVGARLLHPQGVEGSATLRRLADGMAQLLEATAGYDLSVSTAVSQLIGLGQGVTPTGDDLLVGYIAGLWCRIGNDARRREYASNLGQTLIDLGVRTTDVSRSFLYHAALGHVSSRLAGLAEAICKGMDSRELLETAQAAMSVGHTSGMDAVTGLLLGLAAWDRDLMD
jgi:hypothetical protein